ncbi:aspartic proteinase nepenthesin-2-like [Papaver somniferum]|uniref:aspartic proteinase nepenthesin-2-like n=1 Tax=Papaver somniferum TaxID=3469 RepID=UPI000E6FBB08|nr:aspartic proteinase nepenthesin-2-like [Papaver somniferum]
MATIIASLLSKSNNPVVLFLIICFIFNQNSLVSGLSFKLIHRESLRSSLYPGNNLSHVDRTRCLIHLSESRVRHLESLRTSATNSTRVTNIRPTVDMPPDSGYVYIVQGPQYSCVNNQCIYNLSYVDTSTSKGILSNESFSFLSDGSIETLEDIIFGCGYKNVQPHLEGDIDGVLGQSSFLRFGDDIVIQPGSRVQTTPFYMYYGNPHMYSVNLLDISVGDAKYGMVRVGIEPGTFTSKPDGKGGCLIDSGAAITYIDSKAYIPFKQTVMAYFERLGLKTVTNMPYHLDLCYIYGNGEVSFPSIIFHFQGADFTVRPEFGFVIDDYSEGVEKYFCLGMKPRNDITLIGSMQQQNTRFIFDASPRRA